MIKIGEDFPKITWRFFDIDLLEPNAFLGDLIIAMFALYFGLKIRKIYIKYRNKFHLFWYLFFLITSLTFIMGGLGHLLYNYWGVKGKYFAWFSGFFSMFMLEMAILCVLPKDRVFAKYFSFLKLIIMLFTLLITVNFVNTEKISVLGLIFSFINSFLGMTYYCGYQALKLSKKYDSAFIYCFYAFLLVFPIIIIQGLKINLHQWFDRNDLSHVLLIISIILYYISIKKVTNWSNLN